MRSTIGRRTRNSVLCIPSALGLRQIRTRHSLNSSASSGDKVSRKLLTFDAHLTIQPEETTTRPFPLINGTSYPSTALLFFFPTALAERYIAPSLNFVDSFMIPATKALVRLVKMFDTR